MSRDRQIHPANKDVKNTMMLMTRIRSLVPDRRAVMTVAISGALGAMTSIGVTQSLRTSGAPAWSAAAAVDQRFVSLGKAYLLSLGNAYGAAWDHGANALDSGQGVSAGLELVAQTWTANRIDIYDKQLTPELVKIVPEGAGDADVTPAERAAMAAAWRGLALGLRQSSVTSPNR